MRNVHLFRDSRGPFRMFEAPAEHYEYILGADIALGEEEKRTVGDRSSLTVLKRCYPMGLEQVFEATYRCDSGHFGEIIAAVGKMYNHAWINIERNWSHAPRAALQRAQYPISRFYIPPEHGSTREGEQKIYFFHKGPATQKYLTDTFVDYLHQRLITIRSKQTLQELSSLQKDPKGMMMTRGKDRSVAIFMGTIVDATVGRPPPLPEEKIKPPPRAPEGEDVGLWMKRMGLEKKKDQPSDAATWAELGSADGDGMPEFSDVVYGSDF